MPLGPEEEEWRPVEGWPYYEVSSLGRVRRVCRYESNGNGARRWRPTRILRQHPGGRTGQYRRVILGNRRKGKGARWFAPVHVLVCQAFHGPAPSPAHEVCHNEDNPADNRASMLRWGTKAENMEDRRRRLREAADAGYDMTEAEAMRVGVNPEEDGCPF